VAQLTSENALRLPRIDTNFIPKVVDAAPNSWTARVVDASGLAFNGGTSSL
jgi:hypothetical protein